MTTAESGGQGDGQANGPGESSGVGTTPRIGVALGSGSARGWAHIGVITALEELGLEPSVVCGASIGALVGAAYVTGRLSDLEDWVRNLSWLEMARLLDLRLSKGGLLEGERLFSFLRNLHDDPPIESLEKPFAAVATDLSSGRELWLREGSLLDAVRASMALPGLLSPVTREGVSLVDGGLVNPVPVAPCRALGAELIIAVNLNGELTGRRAQRRLKNGPNQREEFVKRVIRNMPDRWRSGAGQIVPQLLSHRGGRPNYFDVVFGAINIMQDRITRARMAGDPPDVILAPRIGHIGLLEFNRADEAIEGGRISVAEMRPAIDAAVERAQQRAP